LQVRKALEDLGDPKPGVSVRNRIVTLWGTVSSREASRKAEERLRQVLGLAGIRNELRIQAGSDSLSTEAVLAPLPRRAPFAEPAVPTVTRRQEALVQRPNEQGVAPTPDRAWRPSPGPDVDPVPTLEASRGQVQWKPKGGGVGEPRNKVVSQATRSLPSAKSQLAAKRPALDAQLEQAVDALRLKDTRFRGLQADVIDGTVYLRGTVFRMEHVFDLARSLSRLPGVQGVMLDEVRAESRR
jgi:osmotically-inducible protein OsmY